MRRTMRRLTALALGSAVLLAGCGDKAAPTTPAGTPADPPPTLGPGPRWDGATEVDFTTGTVTAPGFNDLIDAEAPEWATDPLGTVTALLHLDRTDARIKTGLADGAGDPVVTVVLSGLGDDSIAAIRYRIVLTQGDDGRFRFAAGEAAWRCQPGRGPVEFGTRSCV